MDYVINPAWLYWMMVLTEIKMVCTIFAIIAGLVLLFSFLTMLYNREFGEEDEDYKLARTVTRIAVPVFIATLLIAIFAPSTKVLVEMLVAKIATKQNLQLTIEGMKSLVDYITETIKSLK